jgi:hypothetical protein
MPKNDRIKEMELKSEGASIFLSALLAFLFGVCGIFLAQFMFDDDSKCVISATIGWGIRSVLLVVLLTIIILGITSK